MSHQKPRVVEKWVQVAGHPASPVRVTAADAGASDWLVLWPGLGGTAEEFRRLLREGPDRGWSVAALDPPGHGQSGAWDRWTSGDPDAVWDAVLVALGAPADSVLGGHSAGAYFALEYAQHHPTRGLILLDGGYLDPLPDGADLDALYTQNQEYLASRRFPSWEGFIATERAQARHWDSDADAMLRSQMAEVSRKVVPRISAATATQVMARLAPYRVSELAPVLCPALVAVATEPADLCPRREDALAHFRRIVGGAEAVRIPQAGHDLLLDNPQAVAGAVWAFLSAHLPRAADNGR